MATEDFRRHPAVREMVRQSAQSLGVPESRFLTLQPTIGQLLDYFKTGSLPEDINQSPPFPEFVQPRILRVNDNLYGVVAVYRRPNRLIATIDQATVGFTSVTEGGAVAAWRDLTTDGEFDSMRGIVTFPFSSALSIEQNLKGFALHVSSPYRSNYRAAKALNPKEWIDRWTEFNP